MTQQLDSKVFPKRGHYSFSFSIPGVPFEVLLVNDIDGDFVEVSRSLDHWGPVSDAFPWADVLNDGQRIWISLGMVTAVFYWGE